MALLLTGVEEATGDSEDAACDTADAVGVDEVSVTMLELEDCDCASDVEARAGADVPPL